MVNDEENLNYLGLSGAQKVKGSGFDNNMAWEEG
jgi:hypothetical protein